MRAQVKLKRLRSEGTAPVYRRYDLCEWEVTFDEAALHMDLLPETEYHNAYDADHRGILFRADVTFKHPKDKFVAPVFRMQDELGNWHWRVRFRPYYAGRWELSIFVVCWHPNPHPDGESKESRQQAEYGATTIYFYQHVVDAKLPGFEATDTAPFLEGPLDTPSSGENPNYFYRRMSDGKRRACLVQGCARPWVTQRNPPKDLTKEYWDPFLDRKTQLFVPIAENGGNALYHWFAPGETSLVHQATDEYWFDQASGFMKERKRRQPKNRGAKWPGQSLWPDTNLPPNAEAQRAYKEYDQGRAAHTDEIFDQAHVGDRYVQLFVVVMPHDLIQTGHCDPITRRITGHRWGEWGWSEQAPRRKEEDKTGAKQDVACQMNGFRFFTPDGRSPLKLEDFFKMSPKGTKPWQIKLWKHFANFWRYVIARWTAHPALGAWVLLDELEGIGEDVEWWWKNKEVTYKWHDWLVKLVRGEISWGFVKIGGKDRPLMYSGDYLKHPLTSSATHYKWSEPDRYLKRYGTPEEKRILDHFHRTGSAPAALWIIEHSAELPRRTDWWYGEEALWSLDFASHHLYQAVPYKTDDPSKPFGLELSNQGDPAKLKPDHWLWDSLCMRLRNWSQINAGKLRLITEYGCYERNLPPPNPGRGTSGERWDQYGRRVPAYSHFGCWAGLVLGLAGTPFKWNDASSFGEMRWRSTSTGQPSPVWDKSIYPVDNYAEWERINTFVRNVDIGILYPRETRMQVQDTRGHSDPSFRVWGLTDVTWTTLLVWLYDRTFTTKGRSTNRNLALDLGKPNAGREYKCTWFDTWGGFNIVSATGAPLFTADSSGQLCVPLPRFFGSPDAAVRGVADGNDIAIRIEAVRK